MKSWEKGFFMNQKDLIYIKMIVDEGGISQAARKLFVSQPSLSQSVKRIEETLGATLFKRTPKGLVLTPEGQEYYRMASKVLNIYSSFEEEMQNLKELKTGTITIGATPHRGMFLFSEFLAEFYMKYPGIKVNMVEALTYELEELLLSGKVDFAMMRAPIDKPAVSRFTYRGLFKDTFLILLPPGHPAREHAEFSEEGSQPILDPKWLADENFLLPEPSMRLYESVISILQKAGITSPKCSYSSLYVDTLVRLTAAGAGVSIISSRYVQKGKLAQFFDVYRIPESYGVFWEVSLATLNDAYLSRAAQKFIEEYTRYLGA